MAISVPCFNPRARTGRDPRELVESSGHFSFNPRARTGRDGICAGRPRARTCFNPRARTGRDFTQPIVSSHDTQFQSTRPHGARQEHQALGPAPLPVSIHAPARGATVGSGALGIAGFVSIHAPRTGARQAPPLAWATATGFNPRAARDATSPLCRHWCISVSIHAPARARRQPLLLTRPRRFQSTPHGARLLDHINTMAYHGFQSTRPHGARRQNRQLCRLLWCFNPRARTGRDICLLLRL